MHLFNNMLAVLAMKYSDIVFVKEFNVSYSGRAFQPLWFNAIGIILSVIGALLLINNIKKLKMAHNEVIEKVTSYP